MASDRPDEADAPDEPVPDANAADGAGDANAEREDSSSSPDRNPDNDALSIPSVGTETADSGLWSDLKADLEIDSIDVPEVSNDVADADVDAGADASTEMTPDPSDAPPELVKTFWALVLVINAALLAVSLGLLLLVFEGATRRGGALLAGGLILFGFAVRRYRAYRRSDERADADAEAKADADSENEADDDSKSEGDDGDGDRAASADTPTNADESASGETSSNDVAEQRSPDDSDPS
ncbi:DUF7322 domain-containing protein [Halopiger xanaduensis]|uniref:DUF7322 domain-containing protein n=1 Tax=Halopiger xanaduensis (strain DSM 18323 / JCM 14033 / SH-6) TaxID=797210 RepID=F8D488_HALXS|nr:hypothetical protein [Halopiger xanaduensis]AEH37493.1 hypothetical protein Halxa_2877 [Halopiger xanaduensis SH-6]